MLERRNSRDFNWEEFKEMLELIEKYAPPKSHEYRPIPTWRCWDGTYRICRDPL